MRGLTRSSLGLNKGNRSNVRGGGGMSFIGIIFSLYELQHVSSQTGGVTGAAVHASVGSGIWLMLVGFIVAAVCLFKSAPAPDAQMPGLDPPPEQ